MANLSQSMHITCCFFPPKSLVLSITCPLALPSHSSSLLMQVGAMPRKDGMERKDLLAANVRIFKVQGKSLDTVAKKSVKVRVCARVCVCVCNERNREKKRK